ncbi:MAG: Gfo/Idh/MocA family protein [Thermoguttaceae bacterium]
MAYLTRLSRRRFLKKTAKAASLLGISGFPLIVPSSVRGALAPSNRITVACIGTGNQGYDVMRHFLKMEDAQVVAVCDVNRGSYGYRDEKQFRGREPAQKAVDEYYAKETGKSKYKACEAYHDFRSVLARKDIDAVTVVVPDHWHAIMSIAAAEAGKDIYCEKPLSLTIREGQAMIEAVQRHKRILQTGSHERSNPITRHACELVRNGRIGQLKKITTFVGYNNKVGPGPGWQPMPVPDGFDYATWLGPAPPAAYHKDRCLYRFRFNYDYSGGQVTNFGAHSNDMAQWAMGADGTGPTEIEFLGATFLPKGSLYNTATETRFRCRYGNGVELICETEKSQVGARFEGSEGTVQVGYGGFITKPESLKTSIIGPNEIHLYRSDDHVRNFLDCVKSRAEPAAPVEVGHRSASVCHLGNIAIRLGEKKILAWNPTQERFSNDDQANAMLARPMHGPWQLPGNT